MRLSGVPIVATAVLMIVVPGTLAAQQHVCVVDSPSAAADWFYVTDGVGMSQHTVAFTSSSTADGVSVYLTRTPGNSDLSVQNCMTPGNPWIYISENPTAAATWISIQATSVGDVIPVSIVDMPGRADLTIHLGPDISRAQEMIAVLVVYATTSSGPSTSMSNAFVIEMGLVLDFELLRPLISECTDLGALESYRDALLQVTDLEELRSELEHLGPVEVRGCPDYTDGDNIAGVRRIR